MVGEEIPAKLQQVTQAAMELPANVVNMGTRHVQESMGALSAEVQKAMGVLTPPAMGAGGLQLPQLPPLPGLGGAGGAGGAGAETATRSEVTRGVKTKTTSSYLEK